MHKFQHPAISCLCLSGISRDDRPVVQISEFASHCPLTEYTTGAGGEVGYIYTDQISTTHVAHLTLSGSWFLCDVIIKAIISWLCLGSLPLTSSLQRSIEN